MGEVARVLSSGGRLALNAWGALERQPFHLAVIGAVGVFLGAEAKAALDLAFSLHRAEELRKLAEDVGLENVRVRYEHRTLRFPVTADLVKGFMSITPATPQFLTLADDRKQAFVAHVVKELASYMDDAGLAVPVENHFLTALKPARPDS